jgi:MFS family permease
VSRRRTPPASGSHEDRTLVGLVVLLACNHSALAGNRVAVSLDALSRGASLAETGILMATFGLLPMVCALHAGRLIDRVGAGRPMLVGTLCLVAGCAVPLVLPGIVGLFIAAPLMGFGFMVFQVAVQHATGGLSRPEQRTANFGKLSLSSSVANFAGPLIAGVAIDLVGHRGAFAVVALLTLLPLLAVVTGRLAIPPALPRPAPEATRSLLDLVGHPTLRGMYMVNALVAVGWDVHLVFVPIYGARIGLTGSEIGLIVSSFAAATFVVRFAIGWIVRHATERHVLAVAMASAALAYVAFPLGENVAVLTTLSFLAGIGLGAGQPIVMSLLHANSPAGRMGEAAGIRISLIQSMAVAVPLVFGAIGASLGLLAVFWGAGLCLGAGGIAVRRVVR